MGGGSESFRKKLLPISIYLFILYSLILTQILRFYTGKFL